MTLAYCPPQGHLFEREVDKQSFLPVCVLGTNLLMSLDFVKQLERYTGSHAKSNKQPLGLVSYTDLQKP